MVASAATKKEEDKLPATQGGQLMVMDFGDAAGAGLENLSMEEMLTPFVRILQKGSPQVDSADPAYIDEARPGMIFNTATGQLYQGDLNRGGEGAGIEVMVCARDHHYGAWLPRDQGGGFRGMFKPTDPIVRQLIAKHGRFKKLPWVNEKAEGVELVETIQFFVQYAGLGDLSDMSAQKAIISFSSTAMPVAQQFLTKNAAWTYRQADNTMKPAPLWSYRWRFGLVPQQNASGSWFNWKIDLMPIGAKSPLEALIPPNDPLWMAGYEFFKQYEAGQVKADYESDAAAGAGRGDGEIPF